MKIRRSGRSLCLAISFLLFAPFPRLAFALGIVAIHSISASPAAATAGADARATILAGHLAHPTDLHLALETDSSLRSAYISAHLTLAQESQVLPAADPERSAIYAFFSDLISDSLGASGYSYFDRSRQYDPEDSPTMAFLRERAYRTWKDSLELTSGRRAEIAGVANFQGAHRRMLETYGILIMDNARLSPRQKTVLEALLGAVPADIHDLGAIGFVELLGAFPAEIGWWDFFGGSGGEINSFAPEPGSVHENPFPSEVDPSDADLFLSALAHETTHIIDAFTVEFSVPLSSRRDQLLSAAGCDPLNYLRSTLPECFFANAPQEFVASIANEWFVDSAKVLALALARFDAGRQQPLEQFVFFADVLSQGSDSTWLYRSDVDANLTPSLAPLHRDASQRIDTIQVDGIVYNFFRDGIGNIVAYDFEVLPPCSFSINPMSASSPAAGGSGSVAVTTTAGCGWNASSNASWIAVTGGASGTGNGTVPYSVAQNGSASSRAGTITIAGQTFTVTQSPGSGSTCTPGNNDLCLGNNRFRVGVTWRDYDSHTGFGWAVPYTNDSGMFWFFGADNIEFLVKVIDGCGLNSRYWVYAAATTDVEYTMTVTDTAADASRVYTNPLGTASPAITDSSAFATCP